MALPSLSTAKYELTLPSTGEKVEYRPFLVREEKVLLVAQSTGNDKDQYNAVADVINSCTFGKLNAHELPFFDLEYVFLRIRAKSVGEVSHLRVTCPDDNETTVEVDINLSEVEIVRDVSHTDKIELTDSIGLVMKYPKLDIMEKMIGIEKDPTKSFDVIKACIAQIYDADNVYDRNDMDEKDLDSFIESMSHDQFEKMQHFFNSMPKLKKEIKVKNPKTGVESPLVLEGMGSFF